MIYIPEVMPRFSESILNPVQRYSVAQPLSGYALFRGRPRASQQWSLLWFHASFPILIEPKYEKHSPVDLSSCPSLICMNYGQADSVYSISSQYTL